jgi:uncharacterized protein CbrC (UPF0167 family)
VLSLSARFAAGVTLAALIAGCGPRANTVYIAPRGNPMPPKGTTFAQAGIPFPLFEAPVDQASEYAGKSRCSLCGKADQHCFDLGVGTDLMVECPKCGSSTGLDVDDRRPTPCLACKTEVPFPALDADPLVCHSCLRSGRAALSKDTAYGLVTWKHAQTGITGATPKPLGRDFPTVPAPDGYVASRMPSAMMRELLRTPSYVTIQGEQWQFHCKQPMVYVGAWDQAGFNAGAPDGDGKELFREIVKDAPPELWDGIGDEVGVYVFRCPKCRKLAAHWDNA